MWSEYDRLECNINATKTLTISINKFINFWSFAYYINYKICVLNESLLSNTTLKSLNVSILFTNLNIIKKRARAGFCSLIGKVYVSSIILKRLQQIKLHQFLNKKLVTFFKFSVSVFLKYLRRLRFLHKIFAKYRLADHC